MIRKGMNHLLDDIPETQYAACPSAPRSAPTEGFGVSGGIPAQQNSIVLDVEVVHNGSLYRASYFVEHGVIHAKIGDSVRQFPLTDGDAAAAVGSQLTVYLDQLDRKREQARLWQSELGLPDR